MTDEMTDAEKRSHSLLLMLDAIRLEIRAATQTDSEPSWKQTMRAQATEQAMSAFEALLKE